MAGDPGLTWGVRGQFTAYVQKTGGTVSFGASATWDDGGFCFPAVRTTAYDLGIRLEYAGEVLFQGHGGLMRLGFSDPWVDVSDTGITVSVDVDGFRTVIGVGAPDAVPAVHDGVSLTIPLALAADGVDLFGGVYAEGTELDPIVITLTPDHAPLRPTHESAAIPADRMTTA